MSKKQLSVSQQLQKIAKKMEVNLVKELDNKLLETYKENVLASYSPRLTGTYEHTEKFVNSVYTKVENNEIIVMIADIPYDTPYEGGRSTTQVHTFLTEGTSGGGNYPFKTSDSTIQFAPNVPTPKHFFEEHTVEQMRGFIDSLEADIKNGKYNK